MPAKQQQFTRIVMSVPGPWASRDAVVAAIGSSGSGYHFAGRQLVESVTHRAFHLDVLNPEVFEGEGLREKWRRVMSALARAPAPTPTD